jgi:hypothetical protein
MKSLFQLGLASALLLMVSLGPAPAFASRNAGVAHPHTQTAHDRTPTVHVHGSHPRHRG